MFKWHNDKRFTQLYTATQSFTMLNAEYDPELFSVENELEAMLINCHKNLYSLFCEKGSPYSLDDLKLAIKFAYKQGEDYWWALNAENYEKDIYLQADYEIGIQFFALACWDDTFPEYDVYHEDELYHPEMFKLLLKKRVWDVFFPGEELKGYKEPTSGILPTFTDKVIARAKQT
ncbi:hypothetical protein HR060_07065 [Catenovulum sp. SM1970]|uniref:hypothetical protein n=1 Tax=Marinifaba aquimaris TaxID=2741323 RepID=UPI0015733F4C|nr:hypothetical protein [Marinifaba aquimaris]NTS76627.1 hypothetical protein [Marinifaba aquimaris]